MHPDNMTAAHSSACLDVAYKCQPLYLRCITMRPHLQAGGSERGAFGSPLSSKGSGMMSKLFAPKSPVNAKWEAARKEQAGKARVAAEEALRAELNENRLRGKWANVVANGYQDRAEYFRYPICSPFLISQ